MFSQELQLNSRMSSRLVQGSQTPKSRKKKRTAGVRKRTFTEKR